MASSGGGGAVSHLLCVHVCVVCVCGWVIMCVLCVHMYLVCEHGARALCGRCNAHVHLYGTHRCVHMYVCVQACMCSCVGVHVCTCGVCALHIKPSPVMAPGMLAGDRWWCSQRSSWLVWAAGGPPPVSPANHPLASSCPSLCGDK